MSSRRAFTNQDDEVIRDWASGKISMVNVLKRVHSSYFTVIGRARELGLESRPTKLRNSSAIDSSSPSITVGDDELLKRLRRAHGSSEKLG